MANLRKHCATLAQVLRLPVAPLQFDASLEPRHVPDVYAQFTRPHPRLKLIRSKTIGAALIDVSELNTREKYLQDIKGKNNGAYHAARARKRGYVCKEIDRNAYVDDIHDINISQGSRQGRPMDKAYTEKRDRFDVLSNFQYYGVLNPSGKLVAYATFGVYGNFGAFSQLMGHRNNDGIMHLLIVDVVCRQIDDGKLQYIMYDTYFGAQPGLQQFKTILGFRPYRARYSLR